MLPDALNRANRLWNCWFPKNIREAALHCEKINSHNQTRRNIDKIITEEALQEIAKADKYKYSTVLFNPAWHKGVVGIVASRLIESYYRPNHYSYRIKWTCHRFCTIHSGF